jgi:hypothetical protein
VDPEILISYEIKNVQGETIKNVDEDVPNGGTNSLPDKLMIVRKVHLPGLLYGETKGYHLKISRNVFSTGSKSYDCRNLLDPEKSVSASLDVVKLSDKDFIRKNPESVDYEMFSDTIVVDIAGIKKQFKSKGKTVNLVNIDSEITFEPNNTKHYSVFNYQVCTDNQ